MDEQRGRLALVTDVESVKLYQMVLPQDAQDLLKAEILLLKCSPQLLRGFVFLQEHFINIQMQNGVVSQVVPALRYEIFNLGVLTGNKQQLEVSEEGVFLMLRMTVETVLVVPTERQIQDAEYKLVPRFLMSGKPTKKARRFSVAFGEVPDISQQLRVRDSTVGAALQAFML